MPDLEAEDWPHVTLLYLGDVPVRDMAAIMRAVVEHAEDWPEALTPDMWARSAMRAPSCCTSASPA